MFKEKSVAQYIYTQLHNHDSRVCRDATQWIFTAYFFYVYLFNSPLMHSVYTCLKDGLFSAAGSAASHAMHCYSVTIIINQMLICVLNTKIF
jgi:hypothetical protein